MITTTLDHYSHVTGTMQEEAAARLDDALGGAIRASRQDRAASVENSVATAPSEGPEHRKSAGNTGFGWVAERFKAPVLRFGTPCATEPQIMQVLQQLSAGSALAGLVAISA